jgi:hypothetical protein
LGASGLPGLPRSTILNSTDHYLLTFLKLIEFLNPLGRRTDRAQPATTPLWDDRHIIGENYLNGIYVFVRRVFIYLARTFELSMTIVMVAGGIFII